MAVKSLSTLRADIIAAIATNTTGAITGNILQTALVDTLDSLNALDGESLSALTYASTLDLAFTDSAQRRSLALTGNITFTGSGYADKRNTKIFVAGDSVERTLAFPSGWVFVGTKPTSILASKNAVFALECTGATEASVRCAWGVQA
jgi:hypothetical protein